MAKRATTYSLFLCVKGGLQLGVEFQNLKAKKYNPRTHCSKKCSSNYIFKVNLLDMHFKESHSSKEYTDNQCLTLSVDICIKQTEEIF